MSELHAGTITLLFTDIEGSTKILQQLGEQYADVLADYRQIVRAETQCWHGDEVDTQGDAFFIAFTRAGDAVQASIAMQRALFAHRWPDGVMLRVRMGIHTGEPQRIAEGYVGIDVHRASRIMSVAYGGQVLFSQTTHSLVTHDLPDGVHMRDMGVHYLKDIGAPDRLFQLVIPGLPADFPPLKTPDRERNLHHVPVPPTAFIGREQQIQAVCELLRQQNTRLLTLTGAAGVGKTRLALQVAVHVSDLFADGVYFVALDQVSDAEGVLPAIAQSLDIREETGVTLSKRLKEVLRAKQLLLILDNFEQVIEAALAVGELLTASAGLKLLVTSRTVLHVQAEHVFDIPPLALPALMDTPDLALLSRYESIALFVQRARAVRPDFQLTTTNAAAVTAICIRLDGVPLAIELASARSRYLSPQNLLTQLEQGLSTLASGTRDVPARQRTLYGAIAWSYKLLNDVEQQVFRRLAVCTGGCTLEAAGRICESVSRLVDDPPVVLEALADQSLLRYRQQDGQEGRFWMLQTLREYGLERLAHEGEMEKTRAAHACYFLSWMERAAPYLTGVEQTDWLDRVEQEHENLRTALHWMLNQTVRAEQDEQNGQNEQVTWAERALRLCVALIDFWEIRGYFSEGSSFLERALAVSEGVEGVAAAVRAETLHSAGFLALVKGDAKRAEMLLQRSQLLFRESGDRRGMGNILRMQGNLARARGTFKLARRLLMEALAIYGELGDNTGTAYVRADLARVFVVQGDYTKASELLAENLVYFNTPDERYHMAYPLYNQANILVLARGDYEQARTLAEQSLALFSEVRNRRFMAYSDLLLGQLDLQAGKEDEARVRVGESLATMEAVGDVYGICNARMALARVLAVQGDTTGARTRYEEAWDVLKQGDAGEQAASCLEGLGEVQVTQGSPEWAIHLWGAAATLRATIAAPMPPVYRISYLQALKAAREQVSEETFSHAWNAGRQWLLSQETTLPQNLRDYSAVG